MVPSRALAQRVPLLFLFGKTWHPALDTGRDWGGAAHLLISTSR